MNVVRLKHVDRFQDRHGRARHYFRRGKGVRVMLPGQPGSEEFMLAYQAALAGEEVCKPLAQRGGAGTFDRLAQDYLRSVNYARLSATTRGAYRMAIDRLLRVEGIGHRLVAQMSREHVSRMLAKRAETPGAANWVLKTIRLLIRFGMENGLQHADPTLGIKRYALGEHHSWTEEEIAAFEARWPIGTRERTAFSLFLFTGQRLSDVAKMSWRDLEGAGINVTQGKTKERLWVPLHAELAGILERWPRQHVAMLTSRTGEPFTAASFGGWMAEKIEEAGLPSRCVPHGLRKAAARRLADAGCTPHQIMAITGHRSLKEVERYTKAAGQRGLAQAAMDHLQGQTRNKSSQT